MSKATLMARAKAQAVLRNPDFQDPPPGSEETVNCRVTQAGHGRISMGEHFAGVGDAFYEAGETFNASRATGEALRARSLVELIT